MQINTFLKSREKPLRLLANDKSGTNKTFKLAAFLWLREKVDVFYPNVNFMAGQRLNNSENTYKHQTNYSKEYL